MKKVRINFKFIKKYLRDNNLSIKQFCKMCDITYYNYKQFEKNDLKLKANLLYNVAKLINVSVNNLLGL